MLRTSRHHRRARSEEGAVMMVVMLILLTVTALAGISFQASQYDLRSAGNNRSALQTQYVSEAAMTTTLSWVDATALDRSIMLHIGKWNLLTDPPDMKLFAEPSLTAANIRFRRYAGPTMRCVITMLVAPNARVSTAIPIKIPNITR